MCLTSRLTGKKLWIHGDESMSRLENWNHFHRDHFNVFSIGLPIDCIYRGYGHGKSLFIDDLMVFMVMTSRRWWSGHWNTCIMNQVHWSKKLTTPICIHIMGPVLFEWLGRTCSIWKALCEVTKWRKVQLNFCSLVSVSVTYFMIWQSTSGWIDGFFASCNVL